MGKGQWPATERYYLLLSVNTTSGHINRYLEYKISFSRCVGLQQENKICYIYWNNLLSRWGERNGRWLDFITSEYSMVYESTITSYYGHRFNNLFIRAVAIICQGNYIITLINDVVQYLNAKIQKCPWCMYRIIMWHK